MPEPSVSSSVKGIRFLSQSLYKQSIECGCKVIITSSIIKSFHHYNNHHMEIKGVSSAMSNANIVMQVLGSEIKIVKNRYNDTNRLILMDGVYCEN